MVLVDVSQSFAILPVTVYPPVLNTVPFTVSPWQPVHDVVTLATVMVVTGGTDAQDCDRIGDPPVQPVGDEVAIVRVCVPFVHVPQPLYVNEEQVDP
jgi:hypothetical protein